MTASWLEIKQPVEHMETIFVVAFTIHQRPGTMMGRAHRSNSFKHPIVGFGMTWESSKDSIKLSAMLLATTLVVFVISTSSPRVMATSRAKANWSIHEIKIRRTWVLIPTEAKDVCPEISLQVTLSYHLVVEIKWNLITHGASAISALITKNSTSGSSLGNQPMGRPS